MGEVSAYQTWMDSLALDTGEGIEDNIKIDISETETI
jgi:hypothetical protein